MPKVIYANSKDSNMYYAVKVSVHDPFFYIDTDKKKYVFLDHRELGVFNDKNKNPEIEAVLLNPFIDEANALPDETSTANKLAHILFKKYELLEKPVKVPANFPLAMADFLRGKGAQLDPVSAFYPERVVKSKDEISYVRDSMDRLVKAFSFVEDVLREAVIKGDRIIHQGEVLTSEKLKREVGRHLLMNDLIDLEGMIISTGVHAAIPHHPGEGPLRPHETIIVDIFPRHQGHGYHGDMTRTYVKGQPREEIKKLYQAVLETQEKAIAAVRPGMTGKEIHDICVRNFLDLGYHADDKGFIHGTGHGLGIDIHEAPYLNKFSQDILAVGHIFSIEPGLYYPEIGGVRIEDIVVVTDDGSENLTAHHKDYIIP
jgi:Xaa-Pro aminopeptidase